MNWNKLKDFKCPKCFNLLTNKGELNECNCGFKIGNKKLSEIIKPKKYYKEPDRSDWE